jgi:hypothetical protein
MEDGFYDEPKHVSDQLPEYHIQILLADFNVNIGRQDIKTSNRERKIT